MILAAHATVIGRTARLDRRLREAGVPLALVVTVDDFTINDVVDATSDEAIDCLALPLGINTLARRLQRVVAAAGPLVALRGRRGETGARLNQLNRREREVLEGAATGKAKKLIARALGISPRSVTIPRQYHEQARSWARCPRCLAVDGCEPSRCTCCEQHQSEVERAQRRDGRRCASPARGTRSVDRVLSAALCLMRGRPANFGHNHSTCRAGANIHVPAQR